MTWHFGKYIESLLAELEWTPSKLAAKTGMSHSYVNAIVNGGGSKDKNPPKISVDTLIQLAKALKVSEIDLLLAYKGLNPKTAAPDFDFTREVMMAALRHGQEIQDLPKKEQQKLMTTVAKLSRKFIDLTVEHELSRKG